MYRLVALARAVDERMWILNRAGRIPFVISGQGHEGAQVGIAWALEKKKDWIAPFYRSIATCLTFGMGARDILTAQYATANDPSSGGRQMPGHYGSHEHNLVSVSSPVATQLLHAVGIALAAKIRKTGQVAMTSMGEGSSNQGDVHEGLNFAAIHKLPFIFVVENNGYAISVPLARQVAGASVCGARGRLRDPGSHQSTDPTCWPATRRRRPPSKRARAGEGPTLIEAKVMRLTAHSSDDQQTKYRSEEELDGGEGTRSAAAVPRPARRTPASSRRRRRREITAAVTAEVDDATEYAESQPDPDPSTAMKWVFAEDWPGETPPAWGIGAAGAAEDSRTDADEDVHRGDPRGVARGDGARRIGDRPRRGRRQEGRRLPRHRRAVGRVRRRAGHRHAADRVADHRDVDRGVDQRAPTRRGDPVRRLHLPGLQPAHLAKRRGCATARTTATGCR